MAELSLRGIAKRYGTTEVIHGIDLDIKHGEFVVFVGPSGCGKTTLLRMIAGLEEISGGEFCIDGVRVNELAPAKREIAMVFQSYALYPHMSVFDNLAFGLQTAGEKKEVIEQRVQHAAKMLKIDTFLQRKPKALSGGQRQRVAIGRAIVREPKLFLFDEPLSNLDAELRVQMRVELSKLHADLGTNMIYVTHDQVEAMTMADRIVVLRDGVIEQAGSPLDLYNRPANRFVAGFIGSPKMNFLEGAVVQSTTDATLGGMDVRLHGGETLKLPAVPTSRITDGAPLCVGIRPEHIELVEQGLPMKVALTEQLGCTTVLYGNLCAPGTSGSAQQQSLVVQVVGQSHYKRGDIVQVRMPAAACHGFDNNGLALY
jgi:multiple sugar transport system ATP-binding protein